MREGHKKYISVDRDVFESIDNMFFMIDESGSVLSYNFQVKVQLFYSDSQLAQKNFFDLIPAKDHNRFRQIVLQVQTTRIPHSELMELHNSLDKVTKYKLSISCGENSPQNGSRLIILGQKIVSNTKFSHLLDFPDNDFPSELFMGKIFDESRYGIAIFDTTGKVLQVNRVIFNYWNLKMLKVYNFYQDPVFKENGILEIIQEVIHTKLPAQTQPILYNTHEYDSSFPDNPIWLQILIFTISDDTSGSPRLILMFRDTTERVEKEISLEAHQIQLEGLLTKRALAEKTLAHISSRFVEPEGFTSTQNFDTIVKDSLNEIGEFSQADEVFIIQTHDSPAGTAVSLTHEWCKTPKICFQSKIQNLPFPNSEYWASIFPTDAPVIINRGYNPGQLGVHFENLIEMYDISTLAVYALKIQNKISGLVGIVSSQESLQWKESDLTVLKVFSEMLGNYFGIREGFVEIKKKEREIRDHELQNQSNSVISMISSMLISSVADLEKKMQDILPTLGHIMPKNCNFIVLLKINPEAAPSEKFSIKGSWTAPDFELDKKACETFLSTSLYTPITERLPEKLYRTLSIPSFSPTIQKHASPFQFRSILSVPIFVGTQLFGVLLVNSRQEYTFSQKETTLFLNVGILIGFSIQNQSDQNQKATFYDAMQLTDAAVFFVTDNRYIYVNHAFEKLAGRSASELYEYEDLFSHIKSPDTEMITKLHRSWKDDSKLNTMFEFDVQTPEKTIPCYITLSGGTYGEQKAIFGIITERSSPPT